MDDHELWWRKWQICRLEQYGEEREEPQRSVGEGRDIEESVVIDVAPPEPGLSWAQGEWFDYQLPDERCDAGQMPLQLVELKGVIRLQQVQLDDELDFDPAYASSRPVDTRSPVAISELLRDLEAIVDPA